MQWEQRAIDRSPAVQRSRRRSVDQAREIIEAAQRLIPETGTDFTVQRLITEAGIALQTFYRYFSGKDELMLAVLEEMISRGTDRMRVIAEAEPDALARLRSVIVQVAAGPNRSAVGSGAIPSAAVTHLHFRLQEDHARDVDRAVQPYVDLVRSMIEAAAAEGLIAPLDPLADSWAITHLVLGIYHNASVGAVEEDPDAAAEHVWQFCLGALRVVGEPRVVALVKPIPPAMAEVTAARRPAKRAVKATGPAAKRPAR